MCFLNEDGRAGTINRKSVPGLLCRATERFVYFFERRSLVGQKSLVDQGVKVDENRVAEATERPFHAALQHPHRRPLHYAGPALGTVGGVVQAETVYRLPFLKQRAQQYTTFGRRCGAAGRTSYTVVLSASGTTVGRLLSRLAQLRQRSQERGQHSDVVGDEDVVVQRGRVGRLLLPHPVPVDRRSSPLVDQRLLAKIRNLH